MVSDPDLCLPERETVLIKFDLEWNSDALKEGVRADLAANGALVNEFDEMVERRSGVETRTEARTASESATDLESAEDTTEQQTWQAQIAAEAPALRRGRGAPQLLHRAAEAYLGLQEDFAGASPRQRLVFTCTIQRSYHATG